MANQIPGRIDSPFINYSLLNQSLKGYIMKKDISSLVLCLQTALINLNNSLKPASLRRMEVRMGLK
jgi:hypothetical protein